MIQMFEKAKTDYDLTGEKLVNLMEEISSLRDEIKKLLRKQLSFPIFKGECDILRTKGVLI